ncbi:MAG: DUF485 domain-containing protein [Planctomycetota bacterium]|nr:DUF485 domain-containing protein [Planctomycetota bacterium]
MTLPINPVPGNSGKTPASQAGRNARLGTWFFLVYCVFYGGFMLLTTFKFEWMGEPVAGMNWAILYGMGLIIIAFVMAVLYMFMCSPAGDHASQTSSVEAR